MGFGTKQVAGKFEVIDYDNDYVMLRHLESQAEYTIAIAEGATDKFLEVMPLGTFFLGALEIKDYHVC
jgi:hypothetical protein